MKGVLESALADKERKVEVIIPALNEEQAIGKVIGDIPSYVHRIIVADNGSSDQTAERARKAGAEVVLANQRGYGAACLRAMEEVDPDAIIVFLDGDYSDYPEEMDTLVSPILEGQIKMVIGSRVLGKAEKGALTFQQRFGNGLACFLMKQIWGAKFTDLGPFRAIDGPSLFSLGMQDRDYGWTVEMQIKALQNKLSYCEVPVKYKQRIGVSKVSGTVKGTILAGYKILGLIAKHGLIGPK